MTDITSSSSRKEGAAAPLRAEELRQLHAYWRACNYLAVGMIYLQENPLLREPLKPEHVKARLLGHWGASPALAFTWVHLNRMIVKHDLDMIFVAGPGHGAPGVLAPAYLEGTYSEIYPDKSEDLEGMQRFFKQFSFPGHIGSHVTPETPGSIHEDGELGYSLSHAYGMALDNPELIVACVVGDGEAETGPLATAWHSNKFLNPARDGAVLPILNLNGYKIANPTRDGHGPAGNHQLGREDFELPYCAANADEAIALLRDHHDIWQRAGAASPASPLSKGPGNLNQDG